MSTGDIIQHIRKKSNPFFQKNFCEKNFLFSYGFFLAKKTERRIIESTMYFPKKLFMGG